MPALGITVVVLKFDFPGSSIPDRRGEDPIRSWSKIVFGGFYSSRYPSWLVIDESTARLDQLTLMADAIRRIIGTR